MLHSLETLIKVFQPGIGNRFTLVLGFFMNHALPHLTINTTMANKGAMLCLRVLQLVVFLIRIAPTSLRLTRSIHFEPRDGDPIYHFENRETASRLQHISGMIAILFSLC